MLNPCKKDCRERYPGCRKVCLMRRAYEEQLAEIREAKKRDRLLDGYITDACRTAKRGARRHDGRHIR